MSNHWHTILNLIQEGSLRISTLSKQTGIGANKISSWKSQGSKPKYEDALLLKEWVRKYRPELYSDKDIKPKTAMTLQDMAAMLTEMSAKMVVLQSAICELLSIASHKPFEQVAQTVKDAEQKQLDVLRSKFE